MSVKPFQSSTMSNAGALAVYPSFSADQGSWPEHDFPREVRNYMMTCFHYYDNLAEDWLRDMSEDLGMSYVEGLKCIFSCTSRL